MVNQCALLVFAFLAYSVCGGENEHLEYISGTGQLKQEQYFKRSGRKSFCIISQEAKDSNFMKFLSTVSFHLCLQSLLPKVVGTLRTLVVIGVIFLLHSSFYLNSSWMH